ncbi:hypothetical protein GXW83_11195 [Streptacidiphilus sp. PB12-B1b]|uniref:hypothetical protein n=1 Tax=Streptacidiphilus sp. PB12-B1b TaxID=2705012 RepID=UPI0015FC0094|nr:hypothetical protein [Streptacidiphilus sp. PB12-B1b]QMU76222.1 hypothetical protein GXW83_11195 [Streptacidiphilus sp. PB12-B1b]
MSSPSASSTHPTGAPRPAHPHEELLDHLARTTALGPSEAARVVADVLAYFSESTEEYVRRRHGELQAKGLTNERIFERIAQELPQRRVRAAELSARQLRRTVYG